MGFFDRNPNGQELKYGCDTEGDTVKTVLRVMEPGAMAKFMGLISGQFIMSDPAFYHVPNFGAKKLFLDTLAIYQYKIRELKSLNKSCFKSDKFWRDALECRRANLAFVGDARCPHVDSVMFPAFKEALAGEFKGLFE